MTESQLNLFAETAVISQRDIDRAVRLARVIQAVTLSGAVVAAGTVVVAAVRRAVASLKARRARGRTVAALSAMDAHQLADIGIARGDIHAVAAGRDPLADRRRPAQPLPPLVTLMTVRTDNVVPTPIDENSSLAA